MDTLLIDTDLYSYVTSSNPTRGAPYQPHLQGKNGSEQEFDGAPILRRLSDLLKFNEFGIGDGHALGLQQ